MDEGQALHLLNRLGFGPAPGDVARVRAMGALAYVDSQLAPPPYLPYLQHRLREMADPGTQAGEEALLLAIASPRQLEEVLANFWLGWFMAGQGAQVDPVRAALRPHALGCYAGLVGAARAQGLKPPEGEHAALRALARRFIDSPSPALLRSLNRVWDASNGDQRAVLRTLLTSREFLAPAQWKSRRKDDFRFLASAVRASGVWVEYVAPLAGLLQRPMTPAQRAAFVEQMAGGQLALGRAPPRRYASSAPPGRATIRPDPSQGTVSQPGPVLIEAPTPSAVALAEAAARSQPREADHLRELLRSEEFMRY